MSRDSQRTACTTQGCRTKIMILQRDKAGSHVFPTPSLATLCRPTVVVDRCTTHVDHAVDRTAAAQRPTAIPTLHRSFASSAHLVLPNIGAAGIEKEAEAPWHVDVGTLI